MADSFKFFNVPDQVANEYPVPGIGKVSQFNVLFFIFLCGSVYLLYWTGLPILLFLLASAGVVIPGFSLMVFIAQFHSRDTEKRLPDTTQALVIRDNLKNDIVRTYPVFSYHNVSGGKKYCDDFLRFICLATSDHTCHVHEKKAETKKTSKSKTPTPPKTAPKKPTKDVKSIPPEQVSQKVIPKKSTQPVPVKNVSPKNKEKK